jgi:ABC-type dipeptide/oligopeptide/nickel transport system permease subunit
LKGRSFLVGISWAFLALLVVFAIFGPLRHGVIDSVGMKFEPPSAKFWLGTDEYGRDVFGRLAFGARMSLLLGVAVQIVAIGVGLVVGTAAGYGARWLNTLLMRFTDAMVAFPDILLAILIMSILRGSKL